MKKLTVYLTTFFKGVLRPTPVSLFIISILFAGIILNYFIEGKIHESVKSHNKSTQLVVKHEQYKQVVDKTAFSLSQIDNELSNYLLTGNQEKLLKVNEEMESMRHDVLVIKEEAKLYVPKYLVNLFVHKVRNRVSFQNDILNAYQQQGKAAALELLNTEEYRKTYSEFSISETDLNLALNKKIEQLNKAMLMDEELALKMDNRWNFISLIFMLLIAVVVLYQTIKIVKLNKKLGLTVQKMKHATEVKDQFMSNITHELRTPLNSILGYTNLLLKRQHQPETEKWIQAVNSSGTVLLDIINDVLDYSKLESGYLHVSAESFVLDDVLVNLKNIMSNRAETKNLSLVVLKDQSLPLSFKGDEKKLKQVLINLTGNAIKFTESGTVKIEVLLHKQLGDQFWLRFIVSDTGIGIKTENLPQIFERFYQVENSYSKKYSGTGLGLPIVKQLVDMQGGTITVKSSPQQGTSFTFVLPFEKEISSSVETQINLAPVRSMLQNAKKKILVVDDHELNRELLVLLLNEYHCYVETAQNGNEGIELLKRKKFDLVLMDVQMPEMNGIETTRIIRNHLAFDVPIIACTAFSQPSEKQACAEAGMNDYLGKPVDEKELLRLLGKYLDLKANMNEKNILVNFSQIKGMTDVNKEFTSVLLTKAIEQVPSELEQLHQAIVSNQNKEMKETAHNLCSTLGLMGAPSTVIDLLKKLQYTPMDASNAQEPLLQIFYEIDHAVKKIIVELQNYLAA